MKQYYEHLLKISDFHCIDNAEIFVLIRVTVREAFFTEQETTYIPLDVYIFSKSGQKRAKR